MSKSSYTDNSDVEMINILTVLPDFNLAPLNLSRVFDMFLSSISQLNMVWFDKLCSEIIIIIIIISIAHLKRYTNQIDLIWQFNIATWQKCKVQCKKTKGYKK
jgi:hypothetical protein